VNTPALVRNGLVKKKIRHANGDMVSHWVRFDPVLSSVRGDPTRFAKTAAYYTQRGDGLTNSFLREGKVDHPLRMTPRFMKKEDKIAREEAATNAAYQSGEIDRATYKKKLREFGDMRDQLADNATKTVHTAGLTERLVKNLDAYIGKRKLEKTISLYRGAALPTHLAENLTPGSIFHDPGYLSTSVSKDMARAFARGDGQKVVFHFKAMKGTEAAHLGRDVLRSGSEGEVLLPRGSRFRVLSSRNADDGVREVDLELLPRS